MAGGWLPGVSVATALQSSVAPKAVASSPCGVPCHLSTWSTWTPSVPLMWSTLRASQSRLLTWQWALLVLGVEIEATFLGLNPARREVTAFIQPSCQDEVEAEDLHPCDLHVSFSSLTKMSERNDPKEEGW